MMKSVYSGGHNCLPLTTPAPFLLLRRSKMFIAQILLTYPLRQERNVHIALRWSAEQTGMHAINIVLPREQLAATLLTAFARAIDDAEESPDRDSRWSLRAIRFRLVAPGSARDIEMSPGDPIRKLF